MRNLREDLSMKKSQGRSWLVIPAEAAGLGKCVGYNARSYHTSS